MPSEQPHAGTGAPEDCGAPPLSVAPAAGRGAAQAPEPRPAVHQRPPQAQPAQALERQPRSMVRLPTVKQPSVLDPCGSRATSRSIIGPSLCNSDLILTSSSSSKACPVPAPLLPSPEAAGAASARIGLPARRLRGPRVGQAGARPQHHHQPDATPVQVVRRVLEPLVDPLTTAGLVDIFVIFFLSQREI
jgi:hypothetical protein